MFCLFVVSFIKMLNVDCNMSNELFNQDSKLLLNVADLVDQDSMHDRSDNIDRLLNSSSCASNDHVSDDLITNCVELNNKRYIQPVVTGKLSGDHLALLKPSDSSVRHLAHIAVIKTELSEPEADGTTVSHKRYKCSECEKSFTALSSLTAHIKRHSGEKPYMCGICGKRFAYSGSVQKHSSVHSSVAPYDCSVCGRAFKDAGNLRQHQRIHAGERRHECRDCGRRFTHLSSLRAHCRVHSGIKPYACPNCTKTFYDAGALRTHSRIHTGEKPYACGSCPKCFTNASNLARHERSHRGEKPFMCRECGKLFTNCESVRYHQRLHARARLQALESGSSCPTPDDSAMCSDLVDINSTVPSLLGE